ncbi:transferase family-domain-containing protein [Aspergillus pseudonomiae]|uniref:Transferase family-domain-containing protein n=1 Tax=Aspergillus pseudonomiae TaxID=1506151 RepID=A0A5N7DSY5_9EURO|nr:transferase family-domain-containing protein [Aspergillus pseudonomiae]KAE8409552.1 transferase family-domain-containing protein [Aspergillus pseudonomiae]
MNTKTKTNNNMDSPTRLLPSSHVHQPTSIPLSILDATVVRFAPTGAIWLFDDLGSDENTFLHNLQASLIQTLDHFPQWAGQLQWVPFQPGRTHRPMITYNSASDPGVEWSVVRLAQSIASAVPTAAERASNGCWTGDAFTQNTFLSQTRLALANLRDYEGLPAMTIQVTLFEGGGFAIGVKIAHCLADAQALMLFMKQWAAACSGHTDSVPDPVFEPSMLDSKASSSSDIHTNPALITTARNLPLHRYDWWKTSDPDYPAIMIPNTENSTPPPEYLTNTTLSPSTPAPWATWDFTRPVSYTQLHFTGPELDHLRHFACTQLGPQQGSISRLDALLAHIWTLITQARGHAHSLDKVYLNLTLSARPRVSPPLPETFLGSPIFITHACATGAEVCASSLGENASRIREVMQQFTPDTLGAMLYDAGMEVAPQRLWQGFMGTKHTLVTSWLRLGVYEVDFGGHGLRPRYVHAVMPKMDGCVQVMDAGVGDGGVDLGVYLDEAVVGWVVERRFRFGLRSE